MSGDAYLMVCSQPAALAPVSSTGRYGYDLARLGFGGCLAILQDGLSSFHGQISSDKALLKLECELCLRRFPLINRSSRRGSDFPKAKQGDSFSSVVELRWDLSATVGDSESGHPTGTWFIKEW